MSNDFLFCDDNDLVEEVVSAPQKSWKILIIDDEADVHQVTKLVLRGFQLEEADLEFISAYSAKEAREVLAQHDDIAVAFVDVVMETNHAGLELVKYIRQDLKNKLIRLVLRTGQPGQAPEEAVIRDYDINDYKNKTELTDIKLKTLMYAALRSYRDLKTIQEHQKGLEKIIGSTMNFLECDSISAFGSVVLEQVANLLGMQDDKIYCCAAVNDDKHDIDFRLLALCDPDYPTRSSSTEIPDNIQLLFEQAHNQKTSIHGEDFFIGYFTTQRGLENLLYVGNSEKLEQTQHDLLEFFSNNFAVAYDNIRLRELIKDSQKELSYILGEAVEKRSKETGSHVKRVANFSYMLAKLSGLDSNICEHIKLASPLHDVGKVGIPDKILNKPAKLDNEEWAIMQTHAKLGYDVLSQSTNEILQLGAVISYQHHEKWDGSGYPQGLQGNDIHIVGRITALADVFDALASERCYKPAWPLDKVIDLLKDQRGKHFDPQLVDLLLDNLDEFIAIRDAFPDPDT
ncbi:phosphodiesterase [Saccharobesus litoralis]|uniref:Phosphodiesterase n=1 Tax=Saccharobesus litoralis TaxID=2172099 RepID=A0A2S0VXU8_9ALTE|nr:DUF3369 domain-containing protein [Saccharobesus litoralis]AWB68992.1 phosphodiesterase [Saccharobesus litoralis]